MKRLFALVLGCLRNVAISVTQVKDNATIDAHGYVISRSHLAIEPDAFGRMIYRREIIVACSTCEKAMPHAERQRDEQQVMALTLFLYINQSFRMP